MLEGLLLALVVGTSPPVPPAGSDAELYEDSLDALEAAAPVATSFGEDNEYDDGSEEEYVDEDEDVLLKGKLRYQHTQPQRLEIGGGRTRVSAEHNVATPRSGSFPVRVSIDNSMGPKQVIVLEYTGSAGGGTTTTRAVEVEAGERRVVNLPVPALARYGTLKASGPGITEGGRASLYFTSTYAPQRVLLSLGRPEDFEKLAGEKPRYKSAQVWVHSISPDTAPSELASYSGYDGVVIPDGRALEAMNDAQRTTLEAYVATGGVLTVRGGGRRPGLFPLSKESKPGPRRYGFGHLTELEPEGRLLTSALTRGKPPLTPQGAPPSWQRRSRGNNGDMLLPMAIAPLGRFLLIILAFAFLIGPGSLWVARRRGPAMLLVTIPGTALATCALIIGYSLVADGFTVHSATYGYTLLDRSSNRAITAGVTAYYANLAPSSARFPGLTAVVGPHDDNRDQVAASATWADGVKFGSDFVPSRVYREWGFLSVQPSRARVALKREGDTYRVQNALGGRAATLVVNIDGENWMAKDVGDGREGRLEKVKHVSATRLGAGKAHSRFDKPIERWMSSEPLAHGEFRAVLRGGGFVPNGELRVDLFDGEHLVRGEVDQ